MILPLKILHANNAWRNQIICLSLIRDSEHTHTSLTKSNHRLRKLCPTPNKSSSITINLALTWATRLVLASVDHAPCEQRKCGRSLKREPTRAYHSPSVVESTLFDVQLCTGKRGVKQPLATRARRLVLAPCSRLPCIRHELSRSERETRSK
jgi:hypothetical protein